MLYGQLYEFKIYITQKNNIHKIQNDPTKKSVIWYILNLCQNMSFTCIQFEKSKHINNIKL